jgi:DNA modification methylase
MNLETADVGAQKRLGPIRRLVAPTTIPAEDLKDDPTVKPTAMLEDTLLDLTIVATIVVDPFLGLGSTRVAADNPAACAVASSWTSSMTM